MVTHLLDLGCMWVSGANTICAIIAIREGRPFPLYCVVFAVWCALAALL